MDFGEAYNPYDFASPITDKSLFAGRQKELETLAYYIDRAKRAIKPINLAFIGPRASGKTSFLNIAEFDLLTKDFCVVRIDLDEGDAESPLTFFYKIFDSIFQKVFSMGYFGGTDGKCYDTYLDMISSFSVPDSKEFCPFLFPIQLAKAFGRENRNGFVSDHCLSSDLSKILKDIKKPLALLIDEGNVLCTNRILLEKLRNTFMNFPSIMLIISGTQDLFPLIDDVFSPMVRQFKKIVVGPFLETNDIEDCIMKPLEQLGICHWPQIFDYETFHELAKPNGLCGGKPYEIQYLCHHLFKRIQQGKADKMVLDIDVLNVIMNELEVGQNIIGNNRINFIINLPAVELKALSLLTSCCGYGTFEALRFIDYVIAGERNWTDNALKQYYNKFIEEGVITVNDNIVYYAGDEFEKIYLKYVFKKRKAIFDISNYSIDMYFNLAMMPLMLKYNEDPLYAMMAIGKNNDVDLNIIKKSIDVITGPGHKRIENQINISLVEDLYWTIFRSKNRKVVHILWFELVSPWVTIRNYAGISLSAEKDRERIVQAMKEIRKRAVERGGDLSYEIIQFDGMDDDRLVEFIESLGNERVKADIIKRHMHEIANKYIGKKDMDTISIDLNILQKYDVRKGIGDAECLNDVGYVYLSMGEMDLAKGKFESSIRFYREGKGAALPFYNLGILEMKGSNYREATKFFAKALELAEGRDKKENLCSCLFVPIETEGKVEYEEICGPDLVEKSKNAIKLVESLLRNDPGPVGHQKAIL